MTGTLIQPATIKDILTGIFLCIMIIAIIYVMPLIGVFAWMFLPLPVLFYRLKTGRNPGAIIIAAACEDGLPEHGCYAELLLQGGSPQGVLDMVSQPGFRAQDQWQVQIQAQIQLHAQVLVYSDGLTDEQIRDALLLPCGDIEQSVEKLRVNYGSQARICILPEGPQTIPYLR